MKHQLEYHAPPSEGNGRAVFLSQVCVTAETSESRQLLDPNWLGMRVWSSLKRLA